MDWYLVVIALLLIATLAAFIAGLFPYPFGWLVLLALFGIRLMKKRRRKQEQNKVADRR